MGVNIVHSETKVIRDINPVLNTGTIYILKKFDEYVSIQTEERRGGGYTNYYHETFDDWPSNFYRLMWESN